MRLSLRRRGRIAIVELFGSLGVSVRSTDYDPILESIKRNQTIKACILDIDSSGGDVPTSAYLHLAVSELAAVKPVIAFVRGTGASGAYLVASAAHRIVATPYALIGSVGVISMWPVVSTLMERLGIDVQVSKSGHLKDMYAFWRPPTDEEQSRAQALVDEFHTEFVSTVTEARSLDPGVAQRLGSGEVYWAKSALDLGLVDELGDRERAIAVAMDMGQVRRRLILMKPRRRRVPRWMGRLVGSLASEAMAQVESVLQPRLWA